MEVLRSFSTLACLQSIKRCESNRLLRVACQGDLPVRDQETLAEELSLTGRILMIEMMHQVNMSLRVIKRLVEYRKNHQFWILVVGSISHAARLSVVQTCSFDIAVNHLRVQPILASILSEGCQDQAFSQMMQQRLRLEF